ncbi:MAG: hypothetical protein IKP12_05610 [Acholeplasmatales bacterium]|nr:hypothetical protein [Acholeplasmatales bacterium]
MNRDDIPLYAKKYRKNYKITTIIVSIFIFIIGAIVLTIGLILALNNKDNTGLFATGVIMIFVALIDIVLGIIFINNSFKNIKMLPDKICAKRYLEVRGGKE